MSDVVEVFTEQTKLSLYCSIGISRKFIQLRTRALEFSIKPPFYVYESNASVTLTCAAHGPPGRMFGRWSLFIGEVSVPYTTYQNGSEFIISMAAEKSGKYKCLITDNVTRIESYTEVDIFKRELYKYYKCSRIHRLKHTNTNIHTNM